MIALEGPDHSLDFYHQPFNGFGWQPEQVRGNSTTYSAPSVALVGKAWVVVAEGRTTALTSTSSRPATRGGARAGGRQRHDVLRAVGGAGGKVIGDRGDGPIGQP